MPVTYPLTAPTTPAPRRVEWLPAASVATSMNPFTYQPNALDWGGKMRRIRLEYPHMNLANAKAWQAFFHKLNGEAGTFYFSDTVGGAGRGVLTGTPLVNGAGQTGEVLVTDGWGSGDNVKAGDWISIASKLYTIMEDATESSGAMTLTVWPDVDGVEDNAAISYGAAAKGVFRLEGWPTFNWDVTRLQASITITAGEEKAEVVAYPFAQTYIEAIEAEGASPTNEEKAALDDFFENCDLTKWARLYLCVWGIDGANEVDMVDPSNNTGTFNGGVTHSAGWVKGNGTNGYLDLNVILGDIPGLDKTHLSMVVHTMTSPAATGKSDIGVKDTASRKTGIERRQGTSQIAFLDSPGVVYGYQTTPPIAQLMPDSLQIVNRKQTSGSNGTQEYYWQRASGRVAGVDNAAASGQDPATTYTIKGMAIDNQGTVENFSDNYYSLFGVGIDHTPTERNTFMDCMFDLFLGLTTHMPLRADTRAYVDAIEAAGAAPTAREKLALNEFFSSADGGASPFTGLFKRMYLPVWGVAEANRIDLFSPTTEAKKGTWQGTVTHAAGYVSSDGSTGYFDFETDLVTEGFANDKLFYGCYVAESAASSFALMGVAGASEATSVATWRRTATTWTWSYANSANTSTVSEPTNFVGGMCVARNGNGRRSFSRNYLYDGSTTSEKTESNTATGTVPSGNIYALCNNANGTAAEFCPSTVKMSMIALASPTGVDAWNDDWLAHVINMFKGFETHAPPLTTVTEHPGTGSSKDGISVSTFLGTPTVTVS